MAKAKVKLNDENKVTVNGAVIDGQTFSAQTMLTLAFYAARNIVRKAIGKTEDAAEQLALGIAGVQSIVDGSAFARKAREKFGLDRLIAVLSELPATPGGEPMGKDVAESLVSKRQTSLSPEDFDKWTSAVRRQPEFKRIYSVKYPRKSSDQPKKRRVTLEGLLT